MTSLVTVIMDSLPVESTHATMATAFEEEKVKAMHAAFGPETLAKMQAALEEIDQAEKLNC
jgi:hypothetical protein